MEQKVFISFMKIQFGYLKIITNEKLLLEINFVKKMGKDSEKLPVIMKQAKKELTEYFEGKRKKFTIKYKLVSTEFQTNALKRVAKIPFGKTKSYKDIAEEIKNPNAMRAVGLANRNNPLPIIIPCHRVIGSDGSLTGYAGGLNLKEWLLKLEGHF